ncbi:class I SAM-dependent methyltransferase [Desulfocurvibacter africanus]|nr:class I SAM-dependent methyltransferase [Desulfocurvibacter africanus]
MALRQDYPWFAQDSVKWLQDFLKPYMYGFEWGSGHSTIFFAQRSAKLVSVEHKRKWFQKVSSKLAERDLCNVTYLFRPSGTESRSSQLRPTMLEELNFKPKPEFTAYCDTILDYPSESFDFVSVDGRARIECAINALGRLKPGGVLILDNSERSKYKPLFVVLAAWPRFSFANGVWETTIFRKPGPS